MATETECMDEEKPISSSSLSRLYEDIPPDVLERILTKVPLVDVFRAKAVCSAWNSIITSSLKYLHNHNHVIPWIVIFPDKDIGDIIDVLNPTENKIYHLKKMPRVLDEIRCFGSSHGWLILLHLVTLNLFILNPLTKAHIMLPSMFGLLDLPRAEAYNLDCYSARVARHDKHLISNAVLSYTDGEIQGMAMIYSSSKRVSYCRAQHGEWAKFGGENYSAIRFHGNHLLALHPSGSVESWDLTRNHPIKIRTIDSSLPNRYPREFHSSERMYLVESGKEILLVIRYAMEPEIVRRVVRIPHIAGLCLHTHEQIGNANMFNTWLFRIYKLENVKWIKLNSLGDCALFIDEKKCVLVPVKAPPFQGNSIYLIQDHSRPLDSMLMRFNECYFF